MLETAWWVACRRRPTARPTLSARPGICSTSARKRSFGSAHSSRSVSATTVDGSADLAASGTVHFPDLLLERAPGLLASLVDELLVGVITATFVGQLTERELPDLLAQLGREGGVVHGDVLELGRQVDLQRPG